MFGSCATSHSTTFLGFDCTKHDCLYFDLESTKRRPKNRLDQILGAGSKKPNNLHIITGEDNPGRIGEGFEAQVEYQMHKYPGIKLIVIDVFQLIRQPAKRNQTGYDRDYEDFRALKQIVDKHDVGVMLIHHTRKMKDPSDVFNELSGSTGMLGAQDCAWLISKKDRFDDEATLHITGRDLESRNLKVRFIKELFQWQYIGTEEDIENQRFQAEYDQMVDGMDVIKMTAKKMPERAGFMISHPVATVAPTKLEDYKIHQDPPGISGELVEGRIVYDAFVLDNKKMAIYYVENKAAE